jgi:hypothetical protein
LTFRAKYGIIKENALHASGVKLGFKGELFVFGDYSSVAYGATFPHKGRLTDSKHSATDG